MREPLPTDELLDRAAELWRREIMGGDWNNGDRSPEGPLSRALIEVTRSRATSEPRDVLALKLKVALAETLKRKRDEAAAGDGYMRRFVSADYAPDADLSEACEAADFPEVLLPCKSRVYLASDYVSGSFGYAAPEVYHYPLGDGRWLITSLRGEADMVTILTAVKAGRLPELTVETPSDFNAR